MPEMTPLQAAKRIEVHNSIHSKNERFAPLTTQAMNIAASYLRKIANGEYKQVVHAHYDSYNNCSNCGAPCLRFTHPNKPSESVCWNCGAAMDGKDGNA